MILLRGMIFPGELLVNKTDFSMEYDFASQAYSVP